MMKKKILLIGVVILLLVVSFFAGETFDSNKESFPEKTMSEKQALQEKKTGNTDLSAKIEVEEEKAEKAEGNLPEGEVSGPEEKPQTVQGSKPSDAEQENLCTLSVRCDAVLENMDKLTEGKQGLVPKDGIIYPEQQVEFSEGESVFDVLYRTMRENGIHFEFVKTPMYNSVYIEGIGNLYEFDCGEYSGWVYRVNGEKAKVGCSQYPVKKGDVIVFSYTCNFLKER